MKTRRAAAALIAIGLALGGFCAEAEAFIFRGGQPATGGSSSPLTAAQFTITNWNASGTSPGYMRIGMPFKDGDVAATSTVTLQRGASVVASQFDQRTYWPSGCLRFAVCTLRDTTFSASESRTYTPYVNPNTSWNNSGPFTIATITGAHDFNVAFSSVTQSNNSNTTTRGSGAFTLDFNTVLNQTSSGVATRLTCVASGPVCQTWMAWGMAIDNSTSTPDPDLKGYVYVTVWNNGSNSPADFEYGAVISQDWWATTAATKYRLNYTATLKDASTTIQTYSSIQHPYHSSWLTATMTADSNAGRRFWANAIPTLGYGPNQTYWVSTGLPPPLNTSASYTFGTNPYTTTTYTPCAGMNVNTDVNATGGSNGRGLYMDSDCWAFLSQRQNDVMIARISALSGLGIVFHARSNDTRTRPQDSGVADIASTPTSIIMRPQASSFYTFTAQGMPTPVDAYSGTGGLQHGYQTPTGGTGVWSDFGGTSHASTYCYFLYMLEGERHWLECLGDLTSNAVQAQNANNFGATPPPPYYNYTNYRSAFGIPNTTYSAINNMFVPNNTRATGWALCLNAIPVAMYPQYDALGNTTPEQPFFVALNTQNNQYAASALSYMPTSQINAGWYVDEQNDQIEPNNSVGSPWMQAFIGMGAYANYQLTGDSNALTFGNYIANHAINLVNSGIYRSISYRMMFVPICGSGGAWNASTNDFFPSTANPQLEWVCSITTGTNVVAVTAVIDLGTSFTIANGDTFYVSGSTEGGSDSTVPTELTQGTPYYVVNYSSNTDFQLSATISGSPVTFGSNYTGVRFGWIGAQQSAYTVGQNPPWLPNSDSYSAINRCLLCYAKRAAKSGASAALATQQTFLGTTDTDNITNAFGSGQFFAWQMTA